MAENDNNSPQRQFRSEWIWIPVAILGMAYFLSHIQPVLVWDRIMDALHVHDKQRYTQLAIWGIVLVFITITIRLLKRK